MFADEELVMELLINAGQARSDAMEAIRCAGQKDWQGATKLMASSESACLQAHKIQTALISQDILDNELSNFKFNENSKDEFMAGIQAEVWW